MNRHFEHLVLLWLFLPLVVYNHITHLTICNDLVSTFTCQNETLLQALIVIDIGIDNWLSKDWMCGMFVSHECPKREHLDMETDPSIVDKTTSLDFLFFHSISVPLQTPIYPIIDMILVNDTKVTQSIIGKIKYLWFPILCPHEVVCHDVDETLGISRIPFRMYFFTISLNSPLSSIIKFNGSTSSSFFPSGRYTHILLLSLWMGKSFLIHFSFIHSLYMFPSTVW